MEFTVWGKGLGHGVKGVGCRVQGSGVYVFGLRSTGLMTDY